MVAFWVVFGLIILRICAWADTGMRGNEAPVDNINPFHAHD